MCTFNRSIKRRQLLKCCLAGSSIFSLGIQLPVMASDLKKKDIQISCLLNKDLSLTNEPLVKISEIATSPTFRGTGYPRLDKSLAIILTDISRKFKVNPAFGFYDDVDDVNAFAMDKIILPGTDGTVYYGRRCFIQDFTTENADFLVVATCAHEFGHIAQYNMKLGHVFKKSSSPKYQELHADYLSGYYLGSTRINYTKNELYAIGRGWWSTGDYNFKTLEHHGTPLERLHAIEKGYYLAKENPQKDIDSVFLSGLKYLNI